MTQSEQAQLFGELAAWFFCADDGEVGTLGFCCAVLGLSAAKVRTKLWRELGADVEMRRHRLTPAETKQILKMFAAGKNSSESAQIMHCDSATCRKVRIKARRAA